MTAAFGVARQAGTLVAAAPRLVTAATPADFTDVAAAVAKEQTDFETRLQALTPREGKKKKSHAFSPMGVKSSRTSGPFEIRYPGLSG